MECQIELSTKLENARLLDFFETEYYRQYGFNTETPLIQKMLWSDPEAGDQMVVPCEAPIPSAPPTPYDVPVPYDSQASTISDTGLMF